MLKAIAWAAWLLISKRERALRVWTGQTADMDLKLEDSCWLEARIPGDPTWSPSLCLNNFFLGQETRWLFSLLRLWSKSSPLHFTFVVDERKKAPFPPTERLPGSHTFHSGAAATTTEIQLVTSEQVCCCETGLGTLSRAWWIGADCKLSQWRKRKWICKEQGEREEPLSPTLHWAAMGNFCLRLRAYLEPYLPCLSREGADKPLGIRNPGAVCPPDPPPPAPKPVTSQGHYFVALFDYQARTAEDLSFRAGDKLQVLDTSHEGWWLARHLEKRADGSGQLLQGYIPSNYVAEDRSLQAEPWVVHILFLNSPRAGHEFSFSRICKTLIFKELPRKYEEVPARTF